MEGLNIKTVCIVTQSHLSRNPRVLKEAITLAQAGYNVVIVTAFFSAALLQQDKALIQGHNILLRIVTDNSKKTLASFTARLINRAGMLLVKYLNIQNAAALGYGSTQYLKICRGVNAQLYICHQELATYIGNKLIRYGYKVAFDIEDWYSEDLLPEARRARPIKLLKQAEYYALHNGIYCTTTSTILAHKLGEANKCKIPGVIYNVFPTRQIALDTKKYQSPIKLFWFSQTIGAGRGLEEFILMLTKFKISIQLHLLGRVTSSYQNSITNLLPPQHTIHFHQMVPENELAEKIATFDVGLALELNHPLSRNYTITNKFFQYLQAGLPVITTQTAGQAEAFQSHRPGFMLPQTPNTDDVSALEKWLNSPTELTEAANRAKEAAQHYSWENESKKLIALVQNALK